MTSPIRRVRTKVGFKRGSFASKQGFTLIELIIVLVIIGLIFGIALPNLENLSPEYSLRSAAREIGSQLEFIRSQCVIDRRKCGIQYDLENNFYRPVFPPPEDEVDLPLDQWPLGEPIELPPFVRFKAVKLADDFYVENGTIDVIMDPLGAAGNHIVVLDTEEGFTISVKFNALIGSVDFVLGEESFERYQ